jgi:hypothetical protein
VPSGRIILALSKLSVCGLGMNLPHGIKGANAIPTPAVVKSFKKSRLDRVLVLSEPCSDICH